jgi:hypothetical protein
VLHLDAPLPVGVLPLARCRGAFVRVALGDLAAHESVHMEEGEEEQPAAHAANAGGRTSVGRTSVPVVLTLPASPGGLSMEVGGW